MSSLLAFLGGHNDWIEKYESLPGSLGLPADMGFLTWDHRGQGGSAGERSHVKSYDEFACDMKAIIDTYYHGDNLFIVSHSMGSLIALYAVLKGLMTPRALVLISPLLALPNHPLPRFLYRPISALMARTRWTTLRYGPFVHRDFAQNVKTHCAEAYARIIEGPYPSQTPTFGWLDASFRAIRFVHHHGQLRQPLCPTLLLHGSEEAIVDPTGFARWLQRASRFGSAVRKILISGARHELLNEEASLRGQAISQIRNFLGEQMADSHSHT